MCIRCEITNVLRGRKMTSDEIAEELGVLFMNVRPTVSMMKRDGLIEDSGELGVSRFGKKAKKWKLAEGTAQQGSLF